METELMEQIVFWMELLSVHHAIQVIIFQVILAMKIIVPVQMEMEQQDRIARLTEMFIVRHAIQAMNCLMEIAISALAIMVLEPLGQVVILMDCQSVYHAVLDITFWMTTAI